MGKWEGGRAQPEGQPPEPALTTHYIVVMCFNA